MAIIGTIVIRKNAGRKHIPNGSTHLTDSERTRCKTSFAACARFSIRSISSAEVTGAPVISDLEIAASTGAIIGYLSAV